MVVHFTSEFLKFIDWTLNDTLSMLIEKGINATRLINNQAVDLFSILGSLDLGNFKSQDKITLSLRSKVSNGDRLTHK